MTNDAPRTIWADSPQVFDDCDVWHSEPAEGRTEYIRADIAQAEKEAAVAAAYEDAAQIAKGKGESEFFNPVQAIRARANTDALEAARQEARAESLREAAKACENALSELEQANPGRHDALPFLADGCEASRDAILALIPDTDP